MFSKYGTKKWGLPLGVLFASAAALCLITFDLGGNGNPAKANPGDQIVAGTGTFHADIFRNLSFLSTCPPGTDPTLPNDAFPPGPFPLSDPQTGHIYTGTRDSHIPAGSPGGPFDGSVQFQCLIDNSADANADESRLFARLIQNECTIAYPFRAALRRSITLHNVTVAGRTGSLVLESQDSSQTLVGVGFAATGHFTIDGISGQLAGATGEGQWTIRSSPTTDDGWYDATIRMPGN